MSNRKFITNVTQDILRFYTGPSLGATPTQSCLLVTLLMPYMVSDSTKVAEVDSVEDKSVFLHVGVFY